MEEAGPDYSPFYERLCAAFEKLNDQVETISEQLDVQNDHLDRQATASEESLSVLQQWFARASNENLGVYQRAVTAPDLHSLSRAVTMVSMKSTGRMPDIIAEMNNPSPLPNGE